MIAFSSAWGDYDNDGCIDLFVTAEPEAVLGLNGDNFLYKNNCDGTFTSITEGSIVNDGGYSRMATWGDYDQDGDLDLYTANITAGNSFLYANNGDGTFTRIRDNAAVDQAPPGAFSACWGDYDNDGDLDLFVQPFASSTSALNVLFENTGNGLFEQVTAGDIVTYRHEGLGSGANWVDYDNDSDFDLFVANTSLDPVFFEVRNILYRNDGAGSFARVTNGAIVEDGAPSNGASWGDYDNDGDLDLIVANGILIVTPRGRTLNSFYRNDADSGFTRIVDDQLVTDLRIGSGSCAGDYDNDGDLDILIADFSANNTTLYTNQGNNAFIGVSLRNPRLPRGCAAGDYDNDGDLDIFVVDGLPTLRPTPNHLFQNDGNENNWVNINCVGLAAQTPQIGTKVRIKASIDGNTVWQMREISSQTGYMGQNSLRVHFGLGDAIAIDTMRIEWLSGNVDIHTDVEPNRFYKAVQGAGLVPLVTSVVEASAAGPETFELLQNYPNPFNPSTDFRFRLDGDAHVALRIYNILGQEIRTLVDARLQAGSHTVQWNSEDSAGRQVASGVYLYKLESRGRVEIRKMLLVR